MSKHPVFYFGRHVPGVSEWSFHLSRRVLSAHYGRGFVTVCLTRESRERAARNAELLGLRPKRLSEYVRYRWL